MFLFVCLVLLKAVYEGAGVSSGGEGDAKGRWTTRTLRAKTSSVSEKIERKTCLFSSRLMPLFLPCRGPRRKEEKRREDVTQHASSRPSGADATSTGPSQETYHDGRFPARLKYRPPLPPPPAASSQLKSLSTPPNGRQIDSFCPPRSRPPTATAVAEDPNFGRGVGSSRRAVVRNKGNNS